MFVSYNNEVLRRQFLKSLFILGVSAFYPRISDAIIHKVDYGERCLTLYHPRTKERFEGAYWINGDYVESALSKINFFMRDLRTDEVKPIDTRLLDLLFRIHGDLGSIEPFYIMSGYRSPDTNELLRKKGWAVSNQSLHEKGKAVDIRLPKTKTSLLRRAVYQLKSGGVGYYPKLKFVHVDIGSIRYWTKN